VRNIAELRYKKPTLIQTKIIPLFLEGKDVVCCSKTGSGKTAAYMIPLVNKLKSHSEVIGSRALILIPSRELALQTAANLRSLIKGTNLKYSIIIGGHDYEGQFDALASNPDIVIATPGRVMEILQETEFSLGKVEYLIIDEADALFEMGFAHQIREILKKVSHKRQTMLLSATIPAELSVFASSGLKDFALVKIDSEFKLPDKAVMHFFMCRTEQKVSLLIYTLQHLIKQGEKSIIFVSSRYWGDYLDSLLPRFNLTCVAINGKMHQLDRNERMGKFNRKEAKNLIVTDLGARGLDLPFVRNVINFDFPQNAKLFIHRCGRTARADRTGTIFSFFTPSEKLYLGHLKSKIDRQFKNQREGGVFNYNHIYYGKAPDSVIFSGMECVDRAIRDDQELADLHTAAVNSTEKFEKTRVKAERGSGKELSEFDFTAFHPLFEHLVDKDANALVDMVKQYKPRVSHFGYEQAKTDSKSDLIKIGNKLESKCMEFKRRRVAKKEAMDEETLNPQEQYIDEVELDDAQKKLNDKYKSSSFFVSTGASGQPNELFQEIQPDLDIKNLVMEQNTEHLYEHRKLVWDNAKKLFKRKKIGQDGQVVSEDHKLIMKDKKRIEQMQDRYKNWKKNASMNFQKVGDREVVSNTAKAASSFKNRMNKKQEADAIKRKKHTNHQVQQVKANKFGKKEGFMKGRKVKSELKSPSQIAKNKATRRAKSFGDKKGGGGFKGKSGFKGGKKGSK
jgi:ATP-dependent RNA helicase DDX54/DBP10